MAISEYIRKKKRIVSWFLIFCVVVLNVYYMQQKAEAFEVVSTTMILGLAAMALVSAGLVFATSGSAEAAAQSLVDALQGAWEDAVLTGRVIYKAVNDSYNYVMTMTEELWAEVKSWVDENYDVGEHYEETDDWESIPLSPGTTLTTESPGYVRPDVFIGSLSADAADIISYFDIDISAQNFCVYHTYMDGNYRRGSLYITEDTSITVSGTEEKPVLHAPHNFIIRHIRVDLTTGEKRYSIGSGSVYFSQMTEGIVYYNIGSFASAPTGVAGLPDVVDDVIYDWGNNLTGNKDLVIPMDEVETGGIIVNEDVRLDAPAGVLEDVIGLTYEDVIGADVTGIPMVEEVENPAIEEPITDSATIDNLEVMDETETSLKGLMFSVFPFCLPWDLAQAFKLLAAPAEAPHFEIDLYESTDIVFNGDTKIEFDMANYPMLGQVSRWCSTIGFCISLILITRRMITW